MSGLSTGIIGIGFVGGAIRSSLLSRGCSPVGYDLHKESDTFDQAAAADIVFLCLPTLYDKEKQEYDKSALESVCSQLSEKGFDGIILIKSTVEPGTTDRLSVAFPNLRFIHNPEFLSAATACEDFDKQKHIVLGKSQNATEEDVASTIEFYQSYYPDAEISQCTCTESESMKIFANSFYAVKIQFFNEMYAMCQKSGADYDTVRNMILKNGWVNPMHTLVPGTDGQLSYGGMCFPKDTSALLREMERANLPCAVLRSTVEEQERMRGSK